MEKLVPTEPLMTDDFLKQFTRRSVRRLRDEHGGLMATRVKTGWWIFGHDEYQVVCSCGWVDPKRIPISPPEWAITTKWLLRHAMEEHLIAVANA